MNAVEPARPGSRGIRPRSVVVFAVGLGLVGLAVWYAARGPGGGALALAWDSASRAPAWAAAAVLVLPALNWLVTSAAFLVLTRGYGRVGAVEMGALIGAAGLFNYLPMRPGLVGRVAYHKAVNHIPVMASVRVLATMILLSGVAIALLLAASLVAAKMGTVGSRAGVLFIPAAAAGLGAWAAHARGIAAWRLATALSLRSVDLLLWTARYALVFFLIGRTLDAGQSAAIAGVSQVASVIPLAGNGLGLREWVVGWAASALPAWYSAGPAGPTEVGLSADLINRGAELPAAVVIGLASTAWLARRSRRPAADVAT